MAGKHLAKPPFVLYTANGKLTDYSLKDGWAEPKGRGNLFFDKYIRQYAYLSPSGQVRKLGKSLARARMA